MSIERRAILEAALIGYQHEIGKMQDKMREITAELMGTDLPSLPPEIIKRARRSPPLFGPKPKLVKKKKRVLTPEGREAIAAAARRRWAKARRSKKAA